MAIATLIDLLNLIDGKVLRGMALAHKVPRLTTVGGAFVTAEAVRSLKCCTLKMVALQRFFDAAEGNKEHKRNLHSGSSYL